MVAQPPLPQRLLDEEQQRLVEREAVECVERGVAVDAGLLAAAVVLVVMLYNDHSDVKDSFPW